MGGGRFPYLTDIEQVGKCFVKTMFGIIYGNCLVCVVRGRSRRAVGAGRVLPGSSWRTANLQFTNPRRECRQ